MCASITSEKAIKDAQLAKKIGQLDSDGQEKIYLLIRHHHYKNGLKLERMGSNCTFDVTSFDHTLKNVLWEFCSLHLRIMKTK